MSRTRPLVAALCAAALCAPGARGVVLGCREVVILDPVADGGTVMGLGALLAVDLDQPADQNATRVAGDESLTRLLTHVAVAPGGEAYLSDAEADPSSLGADPNGNPGRGAIFRMEAGSGLLSVLADGTACGPSIRNCGPGGILVDPVGLDYNEALQQLVVVDPDMDPSGLGPDSQGFAGHGAVVSIEITSGQVDLVADGTFYLGMLPPGSLSIFEDPVAVASAPDGSLYLADQLARPLPGATGAVFRIQRGIVSLVAASPDMVGLRDLAVEPSGTILVLARLSGRRGAIFRVDPSLPPDSAIVARFESPLFTEIAGIAVAGNGTLYLLDTAADPLLLGRSGAVFSLDPGFGALVPVSSDPALAAPWSVDLVHALSLDAAMPDSGIPGDVLTITLTGGAFLPTPVVDFGPGITVDAVRVISPSTLEADVRIDAGAPLGPRDVRVTQSDRADAFHCELFDVVPSVPCAATVAVGDTLRVRKTPGGDVVLTWEHPPEPCLARYDVHRAFTARPASVPGDWPDDPEFADVTGSDRDGVPQDTDFTTSWVAGRDEYFLVVAVGSDGTAGPSGHYGSW